MRDDWIFGHAPLPGGVARRYVIHTVAPRFIARVIEGRLMDHLPLNATDAYHRGDVSLCEVDWIDATITPAFWLGAAVDALDAATAKASQPPAA